MTIAEYEKYIPDLRTCVDDLVAAEFFLNEFIRNEVGTDCQEDIEKLFQDKPMLINGIAKKIECKSIKELVLCKYEVYKRTIENPVVQNSTSDNKASGMYQKEKNRMMFIKSLNNTVQ